MLGISEEVSSKRKDLSNGGELRYAQGKELAPSVCFGSSVAEQVAVNHLVGSSNLSRSVYPREGIVR